MAELATSLANLIITVPLADGFITPSIIAMLFASEVAFDAAGIATAEAKFTVCDVAVKVYLLV